MLGIHAELVAGSDREMFLIAAGPDHEVAVAAKHLELLTPLFSKSQPPGGLVAPVSWSAVVQLAATFGSAWAPGPRLTAWIREQQVARAGALGDRLAYVPPEGLTPRPYQVAGALEIARTGRALIFDEPRTGKTMTTILGLIEWAASRHADGPVLVVSPASVVDPWVEAWQTWAPHLTTVAWRGPKRRDLLGSADVYVTSYDTARMDAGVVTGNGRKSLRPLVDLRAAALVVDECHYIKNPTAARSKAVRRLAEITAELGGAFVGLSGTPITHHPGDLFPVLSCLDPGAYPSKERWVNRYCLMLPGDYSGDILGLHPAAEPEFRLTILGQHRRVARADVMADLPPKVYSVRTVELPAAWRKVYDDFESQMLAELPDGSEISVMDVQTQYNHLTRLASAAADVEITHGPDVDKQTGEPKRHMHLHLKAPSWKVDALLEILSERCGEDVPAESRDAVVCFAPSSQLVKIAGAAATKAGYRVGYIVGGQPMAERTKTIAAFQASELDLVCATTGAGGTGVTLSRAGTIVFLARPWSLVESLQAEDRGEGDMNATRGTEIIDVVAKNTIDTRVRAVLRERAGQLADLVQDPRIVAELLGGRRMADQERAA
ncbi:DEAD/DEAH box helicase [Nocardioides sp. LHD-245]|uniref:DEAD/DEAH box helicase n=1 Tax=Nocardioides sp. LHD-245 TaxID=3051387 RepID=UPI0027E1B55F|nr:DEAD/DEAH box helicase [Nocardioides sp. LHD-245]